MGLVRLRLTDTLAPARVLALRDRLLRARADAPLLEQEGGLSVRVSTQAYNELKDYERLATVLEAVIAGEA
ncbi:MAG: hypothetical protein ACRYHQ_15545 [Janthinobacterium lividum]